jgi:sialic acid synthase SpsE/sugar phosphate isomerase/epimerase
MLVNKLNKLTIFEDQIILVALNKLEVTTEKVLVVINRENKLIGTLTDGDIRRFLLKNTQSNLEEKISKVVNKNCIYKYNFEVITENLNNRYKLIPVVDKDLSLISIYKNPSDTIEIGTKPIGSGYPTFIIAEIGNNHNGSLELAIKMIDLACDMGVDCVKFQMRNLEEVYRLKSLQKGGEDLGTEYIIDLLKRFELSVSDHKKLKEYCDKKNILYLCTPWDYKSIEVLESFNVPAYKVASADLTNLNLLKHLVNTGKPLILSTGMSTREDIIVATSYLNYYNVDYALLHCNSTYPAPFYDINLRWINELRKIHPLIGYSGHERGIAVSLAAVALECSILERHFTVDRNMEGPDHAASLEFYEFRNLVEGVREVELALGALNNNSERKLSQGEMINKENLAKSIVASKNLTKGNVIQANDLKIKSPGQGLPPRFFDQLIGKVLQRDIEEEDFFYETDLNEILIEPKNYKFKHKWGIPVRFHDFSKYFNLINPDLFEFHLSYSDMELDIDLYLSGTYDFGFVVHAPELFKDSHLMDLATPDESYRKISMLETQKVIDITRKLKKYFPKEIRPQIVANIGGFSMDAPFEESVKKAYYEQFFKSLSELDTEGVELIPQTMAPFPWHFGGQRYQNIFVHIDEIVKYCKEYGIRMCFDVSHTMLTCNHFNEDFYEFAEKIAPFTAHIHMGDAKGVNGEGLQIGEGEIDFERLGKILNLGCPKASFIPEIWQGHKNNGEGFWIALEKLENKL